jgi:inorganic pyrophosphatase
VPTPDISELPAIDPNTGALNVIVETPKGSRIKFKYDEEHGLFQFDKTLPYGHAFPFEFGFLPSTLGGDGDPLDVLVLSDEPTFVGCLILGRLLGVIEGKQVERGKANRNDRLVVIPVSAKSHEPVLPMRKLDKALASEITKFFVSYNQMQGKEFKPLGYGSPARAKEIIQQGIEKAREKKKDGSR